MLKNISIIAILSLLISCQSTKKSNEINQEQEFDINQQVIEEEQQFEVIEDEQQASEINEIKEEKIVEVQDRVFFGYDSSNISNEAKEILNIQADWLMNNPKIQITIEGHCDERGTREYNIALGEKRAVSVKNYLIEKGIENSRIKTISFGKEKPAFFGNSQETHAKNRRAVVVVK